jgi:hypothetical protein
MNMGILGDPENKKILKVPKVQNQQFHYSSIKGSNDEHMGPGYNLNTKYLIPSFKNIGSNDPVVNQQQIFYNTSANDIDNGMFYRNQNNLQDALKGVDPMAFMKKKNLESENNANLQGGNNQNFEMVKPGKAFRGSFSQKHNNLPDTPVFKNTGKRASNLRRILEKRDNEEMEKGKMQLKNDMLDPRSQVKKKSKCLVEIHGRTLHLWELLRKGLNLRRKVKARMQLQEIKMSKTIL